MFALTVYNNRGPSTYVPPSTDPPPSGGGTIVTGITQEQLEAHLTINQYVKSSQLPTVTGVTANDVYKLIRSAGLWRRINVVFPGVGEGFAGNQTDNDWHSIVVFRSPVLMPGDPKPTWVVNSPTMGLAALMTAWTSVDEEAFAEPAPAGAWCYLINESVAQGVDITFYGNDNRLGWRYYGTLADGSAMNHMASNRADTLPMGRAAILTCIRPGVGGDSAIFHYHVL